MSERVASPSHRLSPLHTPRQIVSPNMRNRRLTATATTSLKKIPPAQTLTNVVKTQEASIYADATAERHGKVVVEEKRELYAQLSVLRKKHDAEKQKSVALKREYEKAMAEIERMERFTSEVCQESEDIQNRIEKSSNELHDTQLKIDKERGNSQIYENMKRRLNQEKLANDQKTTNLGHQFLKSKSDFNLSLEQAKKADEMRQMSKKLLSEMHRNVNLEKSKKHERLATLEKDAQHRQEAALRFEEGVRRRAYITEVAAMSDQAAKDVAKRESYIAHKLYYDYLCKKLVSEHEKSNEIEALFSKLKLQSGLNDPVEIVEVYISKDETYKLLMQQIANAEVNLDALQAQFSEQSQQLIEARMMNAGTGVLADTEEELEAALKRQVDYRMRLSNAQEIHGEMKRWGLQQLARLTDDVVEGSLKSIFERLLQCVQENTSFTPEERAAALSEIDLYEKKSPTKLISGSDYYRKNIRVQFEDVARSIREEVEASSEDFSDDDEMLTQREMIKTQADLILAAESLRKSKKPAKNQFKPQKNETTAAIAAACSGSSCG